MRTKVHVIRIIVYALLLLLSIALYRFMHSHFLFIYMIIMIIAPVLSIIGLFIKRQFITLEVISQGEPGVKNELSYVRVLVKNTSYLMSLDIKFKLKITNLFFNNSSSIVMSVPARMHADFETLVPIRHTLCGLWEYSVDSITIIDMLGFIELKKKVNTKSEIVVLPDKSENIKGDMQDFQEGMTESEESNKKGSDFSDVNDVREYIPGDKLMSIHWKLSAKRDILMVKDRVSMSDQQMVIVMDLSGDKHIVDGIISATYKLCYDIIHENTSVRLLWWSEAEDGFSENLILTNDSLRDTFSKLLYETPSFKGEDIRLYMQSIKPELNAYILVCEKEGEIDGIVTRQD